MAEYALLGKRIPKPDAVNRVTGRMVYADDMAYPASWPAKFSAVRSRMGAFVVSTSARPPGYRVCALS